MLCALNNDFYQRNAASFARTRNNSWRGWELCLESVPFAPTRVLDVACGTMRFREWLSNRPGQGSFEYYGIDSCPALLPEDVEAGAGANDGAGAGAETVSSVYFQQLDVLEALLASESCGAEGVSSAGALKGLIQAPLCDLVVSFGFMHHIPGAACRREFLRLLLKKTQPGGYVALSFWQFMNSEQLAERARQTTEEGLRRLSAGELVRGLDWDLDRNFGQNSDSDLDKDSDSGPGPDSDSDSDSDLDLDFNDYLLGWDGKTDTLRYCHHFAPEEIDELAESVRDLATVQARFSCDGRTGNLNGYLVLQRRAAH